MTKPYRRLNSNDRILILQSYREGKSGAYTARRIGCSATTVYNFLAKHDFHSSRKIKKGVRKKTLDVIEDYNAGMSLDDIAKKYNYKSRQSASAVLVYSRQQHPEMYISYKRKPKNK